ncbi:MAG: histone deacetylase [bacterium]|nr:histone deacetylase [bacterium]
MIKYRMIYEQLLKEGVVNREDFLEPSEALDSEVLLVHDPQWVEKLKRGSLSNLEILTLEIPYSEELVKETWLCAGGTILTCKHALNDGICIHLGGGFHHAFPDHGEGFCLLNDIAIGIRKLCLDGDIERAMIIDCDLHQGNGTAYIFARDENVFTFSIHQENNYPAVKERSDLDIGLEDGTTDEEYLTLLSAHIPRIVESFRPELILYVAGADVYEDDQLGGLNLTMEGLKKRDELVIGEALQNKIPIACVLAGGYARKVEDTVNIHVNLVKVAKDLSLGG